MSANIKNPAEIEAMREGGKILGSFLAELKDFCKAGISTMEIEEKAAALFASRDDISPSFKGYHGYPYILCTSVNENVVHTYPSKDVILKEGDLINIDCGVFYKELHTDSAIVTGIGNVSKDVQTLMDVNNEALYAGIDQALVGNRVGDISETIQTIVEEAGFTIIYDLIGHGVGRKLHEEPQVPNFGTAGKGPVLKAGMTIAVEPIIAMSGDGEIKVVRNGWDIVTANGSIASQAEHTVLITEDGPEILTRRD